MFRTSLIFLILIFVQYSCGSTERNTGNGNPEKAIIPGAWQTEKYFPLLEGKAIALVANHSSLVGNIHLVDTLLSAGFDLQKVFGPEHGFRGEAADGEHVQSGIDPKTGMQIISLYGANRRPRPEDIKDLDLIIFDIQDVGTRFYTYISTMSYVMEEAARQGIPMLILDRPNPNGHFVDGPILEKQHSSFVGLHPIPIAHGMTVAEYAQMVNGQGWLGDGLQCSLHIVTVENYHRQMWYELPVAPSPNLPNMISIMLYPGLCLFEGTAISVGRGTDFPFQVYGHPDLPAEKFPFTFTPKSRRESVYPPLEGKLCHGMDLRGYDPQRLMSISKVDLQHILHAYKHFPHKEEFFLNSFERLAGTSQLRKQIIDGKTEEEIRQTWKEGIKDFIEMRKPYLLYPDIF
ncbi:MAG: DUF1343 domain-containing protein [Bacteroidetes bacterium]|nr:MAG: DUF1343 domain-containing protein [Bacteroidota bacterium]